ncbi:MerR family transcriptional regulator [Litorihabitans aurantiacus]|uniref:Transcriptional regulator, MerR family protein n=1 Tax=Litorihabitans aurantiacus TaxID=1930061 RepID=A0AA37XHL6_9MICO|nr:MerR family transcriptional regulator [Litorihabitans aurantiacus]GMA33007.1 transcriptional regulator, MerR family protein [Litorihabitans aurantiacus]
MGWSTREVAALAGTSRRAVRHYHAIGLLPEPARAANGYKSYGVADLTRLLRIRQLVDLGAPLSQIRAMEDGDARSEEALRALDAEAEATIDRLARVRAEIAVMLETATAEDRPAPAGTAADAGFLTVLDRVVDADTARLWREAVASAPSDEAAARFTHLEAEADDGVRAELAVGLAAYVRALQAAHPRLADALAGAPGGRAAGIRTLDVALADLYNPAQMDVLARLGRELAAPG